MYHASIFCVDSLRVKSKNIFVSSSLPASIFSKVGPLSFILVKLLASSMKNKITIADVTSQVPFTRPLRRVALTLKLIELHPQLMKLV